MKSPYFGDPERESQYESSASWDLRSEIPDPSDLAVCHWNGKAVVITNRRLRAKL